MKFCGMKRIGQLLVVCISSDVVNHILGSGGIEGVVATNAETFSPLAGDSKFGEWLYDLCY